MPLKERIEGALCSACGSLLSISVNWDAVIENAINAAVVGVVGGAAGLLGKFVVKKLLKSKPKESVGDKPK